MAKRKRARRPGSSAPARSQAPQSRGTEPAAHSVTRPATAPALRAAVPPQTGAATSPVFATEYHYVLTDLKRLAVLAAGLFAVLIILALVWG